MSASPGRARIGWLLGSALAVLCLAAGVAAAHDGGAGTCPSGGVAFVDVPSDHFAAEDISCLTHLGIVRGTGPDTFSPDRPVTRGQAAALLARLWRGQGRACPDSAGFADVPAGHFARADIGCLRALGIIRGTGPETFSPEAAVTRGQAAAFVARLMRAGGKECPSASHPFSDVPGGHFAGADIGCLHTVGIVRGTGPDTFSPDLSVTRAQVAALLARVWRSDAEGPAGGDPGAGAGLGGGGGGGAAPPSDSPPTLPGPPAPWLAADTRDKWVYLDLPIKTDDGSLISAYQMHYRKAPATSWTTYDNPLILRKAWPPIGFTGFNMSDGVFGYGERYTIRLKVSDGSGWSRWSASVVVVVGSPARPSKPVLGVGHRSLRVSWTAPADNGSAITGYRVRYRATGTSGWSSRSVAGHAQSSTVTSLTNDTEYEVQVRAVNARGAGSWSPSSRATPTRPASPGVPTGLVLIPGDAQVAVSWNTPAANGRPVSGYQVQYRSTDGYWTDHTHTGLTTSATITGLTNDTEYQVRVRTADTGQTPTAHSAWTPTSTATPSTTVATPPAPTGLTLAAAHHQITASWTPPTYTGPSVTGYHLRYKTSTASTWTTLADPVTVTPAAITGLANGTGYDVAVNAANQNGSGAWSTSVSATLPSVPAAPPAPSLTPGDQQIDASWTPPVSDVSPITGYNVRYRPTGGTWADHSHTGLTSLTTITGLTNDTQYEVQVNATNTHGTGDWSPSAKATPETAPDPCSPVQPVAPTIRAIGSTLSLTLVHPGPRCARQDQYEFRYKAADISTWTTELKPFSHNDIATLTLDADTDGAEYEVQFRGSTTEYGPGLWSPIVTVTTAGPASPAYTLSETGTENRSQTWTVYTCEGGDLTRHEELDTASEITAYLNANLKPKLSLITSGEYDPTFVAATGEMPTGAYTGGYSLWKDCRADTEQHIVFSHHRGMFAGGMAGQCDDYALVNVRTKNPWTWYNVWEVAGHEIGHTIGWEHYRHSLDPFEFMSAGNPDDPYDRGVKSTFCGDTPRPRSQGPPVPDNAARLNPRIR